MSKSYVDPEMLWLIKNSQETQWLRNTKVKKHNGQNGQTLEPHKFLSKRIINTITTMHQRLTFSNTKTSHRRASRTMGALP